GHAYRNAAHRERRDCSPWMIISSLPGPGRTGDRSHAPLDESLDHGLGNLTQPDAVLGAALGRHFVVGNEVDEREDNDPNDVNEVPVETGDLQAHRIFGR